MKYFDLIREICQKNDLDCWVYPDGDNDGEVLQISGNKEKEKLNNLIKEKFEELNIDTEDMSLRQLESDEGYIEFATEDSWVYADESFVCWECGKCFRIETTGYANFWVCNDGILCKDCVKKEPEPYVEYLTNNPNTANTLLDKEDFEKLGFVVGNQTFENGLYGVNDNPTEIFNNILKEHPNAEVVFDIIKTYNPFATEFRHYIKYNEEE